jgi:hypothetical protein
MRYSYFTSTDAMNFLALFISLPTQGGTDRVRVWRALKGLGCGTLRDGVYLLPDEPQHASSLEAVALDALGAGGTGDVHVLAARDADHEQDLLQLFDRTADYTALAADLRQWLGELQATEGPAALRREQQFTRRFLQLTGIDFFPGPARQQLSALMAELRQAVARRVSPGEPSAQAAAVPPLDAALYRKRVWATRERPRVDRLASAWLIKRHIDRQARFVWLPKPKDCPRDALGFDYDGAAFSHSSRGVTFETLLAAFGLEGDAALVRIGTLVHFLDVGGLPVAEAAGVDALLAGACARELDDDRLLKDAMQVFDWLHTHYAAAA